MERVLRNIVLIGPVYPFKGGIAHYTALMYKTLSEKYEVHLLSFSMQYPKILFRSEQKDYANDYFKVEDVDYIVNTANPFNWIKTAKIINDIKPNVVIIQWWHPYFSLCYSGLRRSLDKNIEIIFVCHNVFPHERFPLDRILTKHVMKKGDFFIVHSEQDLIDLLSIKNNARVKKTYLPTYNAFKLQDMSDEYAKKILGLGAQDKILLFFGFIREYKGLKYLIRSIPIIKKIIPDIKLLIVGDFRDDKNEYLNLIDENNISENIIIFDGYIPDNEVQKFFEACDLVVLPYETATQSAVVQIAYGFNKAVVVTDVGGLPEVVIDGKTGYIVKSKDEVSLAEAIIKFYTEGSKNNFESNVKKENYKFSWDKMRSAIKDLYENETGDDYI